MNSTGIIGIALATWYTQICLTIA